MIRNLCKFSLQTSLDLILLHHLVDNHILLVLLHHTRQENQLEYHPTPLDNQMECLPTQQFSRHLEAWHLTHQHLLLQQPHPILHSNCLSSIQILLI